MVKRALIVAVTVALAASLGYFIWLNPGAVDFQFASGQLLRLPLGWLLVFAFVAGALVALLGTSVQQLGRTLSRWRQRRHERAANLIASWERTGLALTWEGEIERARALLLKAWRRAPRNSGAALALASSFMDTAEYARAVEILQEAVTHDASDVDVRYTLSEALRRCGAVTEAIRMLETVRVQHPRAPRALTGLRELYRQAGRWTEAAQVQETYVYTLTKPERAAEERQRLLHLRYRAAMSLETPEARAETLYELLQADRSYLPAIVGLGDAMVATGRADEAAKLWERSLRTTPCLVLIERLLATRSTPHDRERTLTLLRKISQIDADTVRFFTARAAFDDGNLDIAATQLQALSNQDHPAVSRLWANVHRQRGFVQEALKAYARSAESTAANGYPCPVCHRSPRPTETYPSCQYWDGCRAITDVPG